MPMNISTTVAINVKIDAISSLVSLWRILNLLGISNRTFDVV